MKKTTILALFILSTYSCQSNNSYLNDSKNQNKNFTQFVNPFIGTSKMEHTFQGATAPFGMVKYSPQR